MENIEVNLNDVIVGCQKNKRQHQKKLHELFYSSLLTVCMRYTNNSDEAKDILQESFIKIFGKIKHYDHRGSIKGWMTRIATNTAIDHYRKQKKQATIYNSEWVEKTESFDDFNESENNYLDAFPCSPQQVMIAIQKLSPAYRNVFNMYVIEGYSHQEIADYLGTTIGTSKSNLSKAKFNLKKTLLANKDKLNSSIQ